MYLNWGMLSVCSWWVVLGTSVLGPLCPWSLGQLCWGASICRSAEAWPACSYEACQMILLYRKTAADFWFACKTQTFHCCIVKSKYALLQQKYEHCNLNKLLGALVSSEQEVLITHETIDWHWDGDIFSTGFLPIKSSRRTTPNAYTSLFSVNFPEIDTMKVDFLVHNLISSTNGSRILEQKEAAPSSKYSGATYPKVPEIFRFPLSIFPPVTARPKSAICAIEKNKKVHSNSITCSQYEKISWP